MELSPVAASSQRPPALSPKTSSLLQLPTEVVVRILALLDIKELIAFHRVSRRLQATISDSLLLQYHIHLAASGMCDGSGLRHANGDLVSTADRMAALDAYNAARRDLAWSAYDKIDIPAASATMPQFSDGLVVSPSRDKRSLTVHRLPSKLRGLEVRSWTLAFDFPIAYFALDASQDLLALVPLRATTSPSQWCEPRILLRTLSNGQPHPLAHQTRACIELRDERQQPTLYTDTTDIRGDHLGTVVVQCPDNSDNSTSSPPADQLVIWNWKTGQQEWCMSMEKGISQWCFLDDTHVVFPKTGSSADVRRARYRRLHVRRFKRNASAFAQTHADSEEHVFALPDPRSTRKFSMGARLLSRPRTATSAPLSPPKTLFYPSGEDHLLTVELWSYSTPNWEVSDLHIPTQVLLRAEHSSTTTTTNNNNNNNNNNSKISDSDNDRTVIPWEAWRTGLATAPHPAPLDRPRDLAPLGPLSHGTRRLAWDCGIHHPQSSRHRHHHYHYPQHYNDGGAGAVLLDRDDHHHVSRASQTQPAMAASPQEPVAPRKTILVYDLHPGRVRTAALGHAQALRGCGVCGCCPEGQPQQQPYIISEALLPPELQEADPVGLKFVMCEDALVVFELLEHEVNRLHVLSF